KPVDALELKARVEAVIHLKQSINDQLRMEAALLQAQIQPHFLFNTLNSIAALSEVDPKKMNQLLMEFGNYLRKSFDLDNLSVLVPIEQELDLVRSYLYIEKVRFGSRLEVFWDIPNQLDFKLPPLSIQPIVENAVKHGLLKKNAGGTLTISIKEETKS